MEDKLFIIPKLKGFKKDNNGKIVPIIDRRTSERIQYPYEIRNLVNYDGYHLILSTERNPFTPLNAFTSGMGLAYIDDDLKLVEPFGFNRLKDKKFVGICIEDWEEFQTDINSHSSRYYRFLEV